MGIMTVSFTVHSVVKWQKNSFTGRIIATKFARTGKKNWLLRRFYGEKVN
jgi:hypothetical protein